MYDYLIIAAVMFLVLLVWITIVLTRDREDPIIKYMKESSVRDGVISREVLADLISNAIKSGTWSP